MVERGQNNIAGQNQGVRQAYREELTELEQQLRLMGDLAGNMVADAVVSLHEGNLALADSVSRQDEAVDALDLNIETRCIRLIALQQPMARELRFVSTALKVITDLERIGDHAVEIAHISRTLTQDLSQDRSLVDLGPFAERAQQMLDKGIEALVRQDDSLAAEVWAEDEVIHQQYKVLRKELFGISQREPSKTEAVSYTLMAVSALERVADHATNIVERVRYITTGELETHAHHHLANVSAGSRPSSA